MLAREKPRKAGAALIEIPLPFGSDDEIDARWLVIVKTVVIPRLKIRVKSNRSLSFYLTLAGTASMEIQNETQLITGLGNLCRKPESGSERSLIKSRVAAF